MLPSWPGAWSVYGRLLALAEKLNRDEYTAQRAKARRPLKQFTPHSDANEIIKALNLGDEETCKALLAVHFYSQGNWVHC